MKKIYVVCNYCGKKYEIDENCKTYKNNFCSEKCRDLFIEKFGEKDKDEKAISPEWIMDYVEHKESGESVFEKFKVVCKNCGSENVEFEDSRGYSDTSGGWGELELVCVDCGEREIIAENL